MGNTLSRYVLQCCPCTPGRVYSNQVTRFTVYTYSNVKCTFCYQPWVWRKLAHFHLFRVIAARNRLRHLQYRKYLNRRQLDICVHILYVIPSIMRTPYGILICQLVLVRIKCHPTNMPSVFRTCSAEEKGVACFRMGLFSVPIILNRDEYIWWITHKMNNEYYSIPVENNWPHYRYWLLIAVKVASRAAGIIQYYYRYC